MPSSSPFAPRIGFSAAARAGETIYVSGMTALGADGELEGGDDPYAQARAACRKVVEALEAAGAGAADVVRTRIYVTDGSYADLVGRAHGEAFAAAMPAATMIVCGLLDPRMKVEVEAVARVV